MTVSRASLRELDEMVEATRRLGEIYPDACRNRAQRFSSGAMGQGYVEVYERLTRRPATRVASIVPRQTLKRTSTTTSSSMS